SCAPFLRLMLLHFECPAMKYSLPYLDFLISEEYHIYAKTSTFVWCLPSGLNDLYINFSLRKTFFNISFYFFFYFLIRSFFYRYNDIHSFTTMIYIDRNNVLHL